MGLPGDYIAGLVDGEGCFALKFRRDVRYDRKNEPVYFYWDIEFVIVLRSDDKEILEKIQETLNCGRISVDKRGSARYAVNNIDDLGRLATFFTTYRLRAKKQYDFELWKEALAIFKRNQRLALNRRDGEKGFHKVLWNKNDLRRLKEIREQMKKYKGKTNAWKWLK